MRSVLREEEEQWIWEFDNRIPNFLMNSSFYIRNIRFKFLINRLVFLIYYVKEGKKNNVSAANWNSTFCLWSWSDFSI